MDSSLDAMKTSYGDYDAQFIDAVRQRWYQLLGDRSVDASRQGRGGISAAARRTDHRPENGVQNEMSDVARHDLPVSHFRSAPYRPWPEEMRREIPKDYRDITFTFYY